MIRYLYMNTIILFCAVVLIFVASIYAVFRVLRSHEKKHHVRHIAMIALVPCVSWYAASLLKNALALSRPDLTKALFLPQNIHSYGFPSGHAAFMFALAATMYSFDRRAGKILYVLAILTGIGRVLSGVHFWYDIVGGAILGLIISFVIVTVCKRMIRY
jgi:undecaprenyl-diphosphatase